MFCINNLISTLNFYDFAALREILTPESELVYNDKMLNADTSINYKNATLNLINQDITYNAYNLIDDIKEKDYDNKTNELKFYYGTNEMRNKVEIKTNDVVDSTKIYAGNVERITKTGENAFTRELTYIPSPNGLAAVFIKDSRDEQQPEGRMFYVLKDHLGSITGMVNEAGDLQQEYSFDAWGRRRHPYTLQCFSTEDLQNFKPLVSRCYTGHEHLDRFGLINMNGRLYDPVLGRVLSPDNYVQDPLSSQNYNRYSYCFNNPLKYTDPSGESHENHIKNSQKVPRLMQDGSDDSGDTFGGYYSWWDICFWLDLNDETQNESSINLSGMLGGGGSGGSVSGSVDPFPFFVRVPRVSEIAKEVKEINNRIAGIDIIIFPSSALSANGVKVTGHTAIKINGNVYGYHSTDENNNKWDFSEIFFGKGQMEIDNSNDFSKNNIGQNVEVYHIKVTEKQQQIILYQLNKWRSDPGSYSILGNNCTSVAIDCLSKAGIINRSNIPMFTKPSNFADYLKGYKRIRPCKWTIK